MTLLEDAPTHGELSQGAVELSINDYPGRLIIMGLSFSGDLALQAYALTGRSDPSKQRIFTQEGSSVRAVASDKTQEEMRKTPLADLIYYRALARSGLVNVVSNGAQTDPILWGVVEGDGLEEALRKAPEVRASETDGSGGPDVYKLSEYEPDAPHFTARISGVIDLRFDAPTPFGLTIVRKDKETDKPLYSTYTSDVKSFARGVGYGIQTYKGDGNPLPSFDSDPYPYPLGENTVDTAVSLWSKLNRATRVAVVVRGISLMNGQTSTTIINASA